MFPVTEDDRLLGCVTTRHIRQVPREEWDKHLVREITEVIDENHSIHSTINALEVLSKMTNTQASRLMVVDDGQLRGISYSELSLHLGNVKNENLFIRAIKRVVRKSPGKKVDVTIHADDKELN